MCAKIVASGGLWSLPVPLGKGVSTYIMYVCFQVRCTKQFTFGGIYVFEMQFKVLI